jgi:predicted CXXCH cytochrome family protein
MCHNTKDKALAATHHGQPFDKATCTGCHNPHGSNNPKLIASHQHPPFASRQCENCHQSPQDGKVRFVAATVNELCESCHTQFKASFASAKVKHTLLEIDDNSCINCHRPHASGETKLMKAAVTAVCTGCHLDKPGAKKFVHEPAAANCAICHDPHGSNYRVHLKADVNTLCTACHGLRPPSQNSEGERLTIPEGFAERATKIFLDSQNTGHPYLRHPVSGPGIDSQKNQLLSCISCHTPHSGNTVQRFVGELRGNALCLSCHGKR